MRDLVLHPKQVVKYSVIALRPNDLSGLDLDQLESGPYTIASPLHGAVQDVADANLPPGLCRRDVCPSIAVNSIRSDQKQTGQLNKRRQNA